MIAIEGTELAEFSSLKVGDKIADVTGAQFDVTEIHSGVIGGVMKYCVSYTKDGVKFGVFIERHDALIRKVI